MWRRDFSGFRLMFEVAATACPSGFKPAIANEQQ